MIDKFIGNNKVIEELNCDCNYNSYGNTLYTVRMKIYSQEEFLHFKKWFDSNNNIFINRRRKFKRL